MTSAEPPGASGTTTPGSPVSGSGDNRPRGARGPAGPRPLPPGAWRERPYLLDVDGYRDIDRKTDDEIERLSNVVARDQSDLQYAEGLVLRRMAAIADELTRRGRARTDLAEDTRRLAARFAAQFPAGRSSPDRIEVLQLFVGELTSADLTDVRRPTDDQLVAAHGELTFALGELGKLRHVVNDAVWAVFWPLDGAAHLEASFAVYVAGDDHAAAVELAAAIAGLFATEEIHAVPDGPPVISSWFQRFTLRANEKLSEPEIATRLEKVEHAIEVVALHDPMSRVNVQQADAMARLLAAAEKCDNFVALAGSIVLVKHTDDTGRCNVYAKTLSVAEVRAFERNQHLLTSPAEALSHLELLSTAGERDEAVQ